MSPEHCDDHSELMQQVGEIAGKQDMTITALSEIKKDISRLFDLFNQTDRATTVQKTRVEPLFWVLTTAVGVFIGLLIKGWWK